MTRWLTAAAAALMLSGTGCGQPPPGSVGPGERDRLTRGEIASNSRDGSNLYEALQALRPHFLEAPLGIQRGSSPQGIAVYIEQRRAGGLEVLRGITAGIVEEVRYLGPTESQNQFGPTANLVTLMIKLRRPSADTTFDVTHFGR